MSKVKKSKISKREFAFLMFNYVVGFGFITTIGEVVRLGAWGILVFFITTFVAFGVMVTFARLASAFPDVRGSSYGYAKLAHGRAFYFFQGWNQYMQGPILSISTPLFLEMILRQSWPDLNLLWKFLSIGVFVLLISLSLFELTKVVKIIKYLASIKWIIILLAFILAIVLTAQDNGFSSNWLSSDKITISIITGTVLSFIFAYGGVEGIAAMVNKVETSNFRKIFFYVFMGIFGFYFVFFIVILGLDMNKHQINLATTDLVRAIYNISFGTTGIVILTIGLIANRSSSILNSSIINAEMLVPLSEDHFFPKWISHKNQKDTYNRAIIFSAIVALVMMSIFQVIDVYVSQDNPFLNVISIGTMAFFFQYFFTAWTLLKLWLKKQITVKVWEISIVISMMVVIAFILLTQMIPPVVNEAFNTSSIIKDVSFLVFTGLGFLFWWSYSLYQRRKIAKQAVLVTQESQSKHG